MERSWWCSCECSPSRLTHGVWDALAVAHTRNERLQLSRLLARPSNPPLTTQQAQSRIQSQLPLSQKLTYATQVIDNSGTLQDLHAQVDRLVKRWKKQQGGESGWWWRLCWLVPPMGITAGAISLIKGWWAASRKAGRKSRGEVRRRPGQIGDDEEGERIELKERGQGSGRRRNTGSSVGSD